MLSLGMPKKLLILGLFLRWKNNKQKMLILQTMIDGFEKISKSYVKLNFLWNDESSLELSVRVDQLLAVNGIRWLSVGACVHQ